ncbi:helix-turn-helix domain-containing protein [Micavibrio aeruginosavorus]|uniref:Helix-turn-helix family protein n=1 Tax=Micavibrio aeruginosavorus (strain ARL-13) TaxID=856793 RepID=G2KNL3_MICAA|nr:helix-turn-helix transcriptional regulator [Micavibrio aeruginosavorus]AEP10258.1 helix-turn-helix family protein [Micavibrio aeruginosavorus ARL-13]
MITKEQCRAGRGLLGWTQQDLADAAGMSKTAINNFERGTNDVRAESLESIRLAFERSDIEFVGDYGVQRRRDTVKVLKGADALPLLWDDIFETMKASGGEVLIANLDERRSHESHPDKLLAHLSRMKAHNITERLLACEGDAYFVQPAEYYRWLPRDVFRAGMSSFIYGDKVALQLWQEAMIIVVNSRSAHEAEKQRFEYLWGNAIIPPYESSKKDAS